MTFSKVDPIRTKIIIDKKLIEQASQFSCLRSDKNYLMYRASKMGKSSRKMEQARVRKPCSKQKEGTEYVLLESSLMRSRHQQF